MYLLDAIFNTLITFITLCGPVYKYLLPITLSKDVNYASFMNSSLSKSMQNNIKDGSPSVYLQFTNRNFIASR